MAEQTTKKYRCTQCGQVTEQRTNHWGPTWSWGRTNTCPECPPYKKYPEYGGATVWECMEKAPAAVESRDEVNTRTEKKAYLDREKMNKLFARLREMFGERLEDGNIRYGSMYRDYASFHFGVKELDVEDVYQIRRACAAAFEGMERTEVSIQPGRKEGNVWIQTCHELISTSNNQI
jgi:hypothetical protein